MAMRACGFTLIEVTVAIGLLVVLCLGPALLVMFAADTIARARHQAMAMVLARAKLEQVLSLPWSVRVMGDSPADALAMSRDAYVDYLDAQGQRVGAGVEIPAAATYVRRWSIARSGSGTSELLTVQVMVTTAKAARRAVDAFGQSGIDTAWVSGARVRRGG